MNLKNVEFLDNNLIKVKTISEGGIETKLIDFDSFCDLILSARKTDGINLNLMNNPILPHRNNNKTIQYCQDLNSKNSVLIILKENICTDIYYYKTKYEKIYFPNLLFAITAYDNIPKEVYIVAVKDKIIKKDTMLYRFPFGNVFNNTKVCMGNNKLEDYKGQEVTSLHAIPDIVLQMPFNDHIYQYPNGEIKMTQREFFEKIKEEKSFNENLLNPLYTYESWINNIK